MTVQHFFPVISALGREEMKVSHKSVNEREASGMERFQEIEVAKAQQEFKYLGLTVQSEMCESEAKKRVKRLTS